MAAPEPSAINGTPDRERIDALHADVQALTSLFEGFSTRTAEDAAVHWQLSGELKARLDNQDQMLQTLLTTLPGSVGHTTNYGQQRADPSGDNDVSLYLFVYCLLFIYLLFVCLYFCFSDEKYDGYRWRCGGYGTCNGHGDSNIGRQPFIVSVNLYGRSRFSFHPDIYPLFSISCRFC
ncbi:hypothetical protein HOY80DRAFT_897460 [Tuber brumale]|nr:hypothetical protein HOY80DRAFT_897460 [Tuber brumale]